MRETEHNNDEEAFSGEGDQQIARALAIIEQTRGLRFVDRFVALGFDPKTDFAGGDWRDCNFDGCDLRGADFRNSRLFYANFKNARIDGADFAGAGDVHTTSIHLASGWRQAHFDDYQIVLIEAEIAKKQSGSETLEFSRGQDMSEKDWFFAVKACPSFQEAKEVLKQMEQAGFQLNPFAYSYVLDRAKRDDNREKGWKLLSDYRRQGGKLDEALLTAAMGVAPDSKKALELFVEMQNNLAAEGGLPGERAFNMAISEQEDFGAALDIFRDMKKKGIRVTRYTIFAMFDACMSFANAVTVLMEARRAHVEINDSEFVKELRNTTRYPELTDWNILQGEMRGHSPKKIILDIVNGILKDPFRSEALEALGPEE
jgi:Pentapeptide repeats (8 copies)